MIVVFYISSLRASVVNVDFRAESAIYIQFFDVGLVVDSRGVIVCDSYEHEQTCGKFYALIHLLRMDLREPHKREGKKADSSMGCSKI
jgi:hypothetical protein